MQVFTKHFLHFPTDVSENSINRFEEGKDGKKILMEKHRDLKSKYKDMQKNYEYLESMSVEHLSSMMFKDAKVIQLWAMAQKAGFSDTELLSFKVLIIMLSFKVSIVLLPLKVIVM